MKTTFNFFWRETNPLLKLLIVYIEENTTINEKPLSILLFLLKINDRSMKTLLFIIWYGK